jgi:AmiR/NasT family two-component response regulator
VSDAQVALRYQDALKSRKSITLATGVIMEREGVDEDTAFTDLLRLSLSYGERLRAQADAVLRSTSQSEIGSGAKPNA